MELTDEARPGMSEWMTGGCQCGRVRYRVLVHKGFGDPKAIQNEFEQFARTQ